MLKVKIDAFKQKLNKNLSKKEIFFLLILFVAALIVRAINIDWGLPGQNYRYSAYVADEIGILYASMLLGRGGYLTYILQNYPFFYYLSFSILGGYYLVGLWTGTFSSLADFQAQYITDASQFILVGRYFILVSASLTVVVTYFVARYMFTKRVAFFAAIFMLVSFGHIMYSQIFRLDSFLPLLFLLAFWAILMAKNSPPDQLRPYLICAILLALTIGTKVTAWAMIAPFLLLPFLTETKSGLGWPKFDRRFIFALYLMGALYVVQIAPVLSSLMEIIGGISTRLDKSGSFGNPADLSPYRYSIVWYVTRILPQQMGVPIYLLAIIGLFVMFQNQAKRYQTWLLYALVFAYLLPVGYATRTTWREMLPLLPFLSITAAYGLDWLLQQITVRYPALTKRVTTSGFVIISLLLILTWPIIAVAQNKYLLLQEDTRELATEWIETNIPDGAHIAVESYGPAILDTKQQAIMRDQVFVLGGTLSSISRPTYHIFEMDWDLTEAHSLLMPDELIPYLLENQIEYVVVSSGYYARFFNDAVDLHFAEHGPRGREFHDLIASNLHFIHAFIPNWHNQPGPIIQIYQVTDNLGENVLLVPGSFVPYPGLTPQAGSVGYFQTSPH